jgi:MFS family permease
MRPLTVALALAAIVMMPSFAALLIDEPPRPQRPVREVFSSLWHEVFRTARSRPGWTGILLCLSPVGTSALIYYFSALAVDFHASDRMAAFVNGPINGLVSALGALVAGRICDRMNRRLAYLLAGTLTAACGIAMMLAPLTPTTYAVGVTTYLFTSGLCYTAFSAMVLETIGNAADSGSTQYQLFASAANTAIAYVGFIDTRFHHWRGPAGLLGVDAALNLVGVAALVIVFRRGGLPLFARPSPATR